jgi:hypothetical protein
MTNREKIEYLRKDASLQNRGMRRWEIESPLHRFLWAVGFYIPPAVFWSFSFHFWFMFVFTFSMSAAALGCFVSFVLFRSTNAIEFLLLELAVFGLISLLAAKRTLKRAADLNLPPWDRYPETANQQASTHPIS